MGSEIFGIVVMESNFTNYSMSLYNSHDLFQQYRHKSSKLHGSSPLLPPTILNISTLIQHCCRRFSSQEDVEQNGDCIFVPMFGRFGGIHCIERANDEMRFRIVSHALISLVHFSNSTYVIWICNIHTMNWAEKRAQVR